jgi:poly-gamma-glutamate capsule biosynthesis protein CapA/YwtB (metallophosphatase superfamily)
MRGAKAWPRRSDADQRLPTMMPSAQCVRVFLCGDVMSGRGIDQILPRPCPPQLHEGYLGSATEYVELAERKSGPIPRAVPPDYIWGAALDELNRARPALRIVNLETSITHSEDYVPKGINYRMSPENADCLLALGVDCCVLANNHILDWGEAGLLETLATLDRLRIRSVGAGRNLGEACAPAVFDVGDKNRVVIFAAASVTSGAPRGWAATCDAAGVNLVTDLDDATAAGIAEQVRNIRRPGDVVVVSMHWGPNWGYDVTAAQRRFAHALIEKAGASIVYGHSSHHPKSIEVVDNRLVLYGCGDFLNDYEGIRGYEQFRGDLALMYFADIDPANGNLAALEMVPLQIRCLRLNRASAADRDWLRRTLDRECKKFGGGVTTSPADRFALSWPQDTDA